MEVYGILKWLSDKRENMIYHVIIVPNSLIIHGTRIFRYRNSVVILFQLFSCLILENSSHNNTSKKPNIRTERLHQKNTPRFESIAFDRV